MYCPNCGSENSADDIFCVNCGARLQGQAFSGRGAWNGYPENTAMTGGKKKRKKKRGLWLILPVLFCLIILLTGAASLLLYLGKRPEDVKVHISDMEETMVLLCDTSDILVGKSADIRLTVWNPAGEQVEITDNSGNTLMTLTEADMDSSGGWSKTFSFTASAPSTIELTARCGKEESQKVRIYAAPEITFEMVRECSEIGSDLGKYLEKEGYEYNDYDEEALKLAEKWLEEDERVMAVKRISSMTLYLTKNNVVGGCPIQKEEGTFGYKEFTDDGDGVNLYRKWEEEGSLSDAYIYGNNTLTNDKILVLRPLYSYDPECMRTDYYVDMAEKLSDAARSDDEPEISDDLQAVEDIANGRLNQYGAVFFNTHGGTGTYQDEEEEEHKIWTFVLCGSIGGVNEVFDVMTEAELERTGLTENYQMFYGDNSWFTEENMENIRLILQGLSIHGTSNYFMSQYQGKMFDNTFVYFGICDSVCDERLNQFFVEHGVSVYAGYQYRISTGVEKDTLKQYVKYLAQMKKKEQRLKNHSEAMNGFFGIGKIIHRGISSGVYKVLKWAEDQDCYFYFGQAGFTFYGYGNLSGKVVTENEKDSPKGAEVTLYRYRNQNFEREDQCKAGKDGTFLFEDIPWGIYVATVEKKGFQKAVAWTQLDDKKKDCGEIELKQGDIYYTFIKEELEPELGLLELGERSQTISGFEEYGWDGRYGIFSAKVADLDGDGTEDLALVTVENSNYGNDNQLRNSVIMLSVYTVEDGQVVLKGREKLCSLNQCEYFRGNLLLWTDEDAKEAKIFLEKKSNGILVDYDSPYYAMYRYQNGKLFCEFTLGQTRGGTSEIGYGLTKTDPETGEEREELVWTDSSYSQYNHGEQGSYNQYSWSSRGQMFEAVLKKEGLPERSGDLEEDGMPSWADRTEFQRFLTLYTDGHSNLSRTGYTYSFTNRYEDFSQLREKLKELEER